ncbi:MAG: hypothetical protein O9327_02205 [Polaromonas sp.]|nr:hypothetical protein [Polaromonas sp.]
MPYDQRLAFENLANTFVAYKDEHDIDPNMGIEDFSSTAGPEHQNFLATYWDLHDAIGNGDAIPLRLAIPHELFVALAGDPFTFADKTSVLNWLTDSAVGEEAVRVAQLMAYVQSQWADAQQDVLKAAVHQINVYAYG